MRHVLGVGFLVVACSTTDTPPKKSSPESGEGGSKSADESDPSWHGGRAQQNGQGREAMAPSTSSSPTSGGTYRSPKQIASELVTPTRRTHCFVLGDSHWQDKQGNLTTNCSSIKWAGSDVSARTALSTTGHDSFALGHSSGSTTPSNVVGGNINDYSPFRVTEVEFTGKEEGGSGDYATLSRLAAHAFNASDFPALWSRFDSAEVEVSVRQFYARHPSSMSEMPGIRLSWLANALNFGRPGNHTGKYIYDLSGTEGTYAEIPSITLPDDYDWATYTNVSVDDTATPVGSTANGEVALLLQPWIEGNLNGSVLHNWSIGGRTLTNFLTDSIFASEIWTELVPLYGENRLLWIDLGTNGTEGVDREEHVELLKYMIARFREGTPGGSVLLSTAYPSRGDGDAPAYYGLAAVDVETSTPGVCVLDTGANLPPAISALRLGYYDTNEYSARGAQSAGTKALEVNESISGEAASGTVSVWDGSKMQQVAYASYDGSTFNLSNALPCDVIHGAPVSPGDLVHYTDLGDAEFARTTSDLLLQRAGHTTAVSQLLGKKLRVWTSARRASLNPVSRTRLLDRSGNGYHQDSPSLLQSPRLVMSASLNNQPTIEFTGSESLISTAPQSVYDDLTSGTARGTLWLVCSPNNHGVPMSLWSNSDFSSKPGLALRFDNNDAFRARFTSASAENYDVVLARHYGAQLIVVDVTLGSMKVTRYLTDGASDTGTVSISNQGGSTYTPTIGNASESDPFIGHYGGEVFALGATNDEVAAVTSRLRSVYGLE